MKILAFDISCAEGSVAVAENGAVTASRRFDVPRGRGAGIFSALEELRDAWLGLDRIAIGLGPGSYNGLRTACALAGSFRMALGIDVVGIASPCVLGVPDARYYAAGDARGGLLHVALVQDRRLHGKIRLVEKAGFPTLADFSPDTPVYRVGTLEGAESLPCARPEAEVLALLAPQLEPLEPGEIGPVYLKPPHITTPRAGVARDLPAARNAC